MVKVKICGITNLSDAQAAVGAGCDALGFVFYKKSPRCISPEDASGIIRKLPLKIVKIGVFVDEKAERIKNIAKLCRLDFIQLHGRESVNFCKKLKGLKIIKAFRVKGSIDENNISRYKVKAYLFDTFVRSKVGGTGKSFNWDLLCGIKKTKTPVFLSGGINIKNVKKAVKAIKPQWVDVSSSVEKLPGRKDAKKVREFIKAAKRG